MDPLQVFIISMVIALGIGLIASLFGFGGGFLLYPTMIFVAGMVVHDTVGTIPFVVVFMALSSTIAYARQKRIDYTITVILIGVSAIGAVLGANTALLIPGQTLVILFGITEIVLAGLMAFLRTPQEKKLLNAENKSLRKPKKSKWYILQRHKIDSNKIEYKYEANILLSLPFSFLAGFLSSLLGIGGGAVYIPIYVFLCGMSIHMAIACSIFSIFLSTISSAVTYAILGKINYFVGFALIIGMVIGAQFGAYIAKRIKSKRLKRLAAIMMVVIGVWMIIFAIIGKPT